MTRIMTLVGWRLISAWFGGIGGALVVVMTCIALSLHVDSNVLLWSFGAGAVIGLVFGPRAVGVLYFASWFFT
jgi:hypothetical protein